MKQLKKYLALNLAILMFITLLPVTALAYTHYSSESFYARGYNYYEFSYKEMDEDEDLITFRVSTTCGNLKVYNTAGRELPVAEHKGIYSYHIYDYMEVTLPISKYEEYTIVYQSEPAAKGMVEYVSTAANCTVLADGVEKETTLYYSKGFDWDKGLFYEFTPASSGQYQFTTSVAAEVSYYNADMERLGKAIARNSSVEMSMEAGQTYYISLYRLSDGAGREKISSAIQLIGGHQHSYTDKTVPATCTEKGYTERTCSCGYSYKDNYTRELGHNYENGLCTRCGAKDPKVHTHSYIAAVTDPTCTAAGYTTYTCSCGESYKDNYTNALGHSYANGKCSRCGAADPDYTPPVTMNFVDVPSGSYCYDAVQWAVANGITKGTDSTHFSPNAGCTRAQVVTFLWRAAGSPEVNATVNFVDVSTSSVYYKAIKWAVANGITKGTDATHFSPNATCTRGQVATFLWRAAGEPAVSGTGSFSDVASGSYCYNAVQWAVANGITKGTDTTHFSPNATCTRGQVVTFLYRAQ